MALNIPGLMLVRQIHAENFVPTEDLYTVIVILI